MNANRLPRAKKSLGQHFLVDPGAARKIVDAAHPSKEDAVLEIGCGTGCLTQLLLERAGVVVGVEIDHRLGGRLRERFSSMPNFELVEKDILQVDISQVALSLGRGLLIVVGTIPYHLTSPILFKLLRETRAISRAVLTMQREVAERLVAVPGSNYSLLALAVQLRSVPKVLGHISRDAFRPRPKVESSVVALEFSPDTRVCDEEENKLLRIAKAAFGQRRKMLRNSLANTGLSSEDLASVYEKTGIELSRRPETLTMDEWHALARAIGVAGLHQAEDKT